MKRTAVTKKKVTVLCLSVIMAVMLVLSAVAPMIGAFSFTLARASEIVNVDESDGAKKYIVNETVRITPLSETVVRLEEKGKKGFEDRETFYVLGREYFNAPESSHAAVGQEIVITAGGYRVPGPQSAADLTGTYVTDAEGTALF